MNYISIRMQIYIVFYVDIQINMYLVLYVNISTEIFVNVDRHMYRPMKYMQYVLYGVYDNRWNVKT